MLTPAELKQIKEYLMMYGKKDSQFRVLSELSDNDLIAFVRSHENFATHLTDIKDFIAQDIAVNGVYISEDDKLVMSEEDFTRILKGKLDEIQGGAQVNVIEQVKVNNTPLPVDANKAVNVDLGDYVTKDMASANASTTNKLVDKNYVDTSIAQSSATFRGTSEAGLTEQEFLAWANTLTHDLNDYVFWKVLVTGSTDEYIYHRYKWDGTAWIYEYDLIPYYLDTDDYPASNSEKAVKSSGIFAFTGNVKYDFVGERYISLQEQIDNIVAGDVTVTFTASASTVFVGGTYTLTATSSETSNSIQIKQGSTVIKEVVNNTTAPTDAITASNAGSTTYTALFQINSSVAKTLSKTVTAVEHIYYGKVSSKSITSLTGLSQRINPSTTGAGDYTLSSGTSNYYFALVVPSNLTQPTQYGFPGSLPSDLETLSDLTVSGVTYKCYVSDKEQMANPSSVTFKVI